MDCLVGRRWAPDVRSFFFGCLHARFCPLGDERRFELSHRADDRENGLPHWAVSVDVALCADETNAQVTQLVEGPDQVRRAADKAIELPDHHSIDGSLAGCLHEVAQGEPLLLAPADALFAISVGNVQVGVLHRADNPLTLKVLVLLGGGGAQVGSSLHKREGIGSSSLIGG